MKCKFICLSITFLLCLCSCESTESVDSSQLNISQAITLEEPAISAKIQISNAIGNAQSFTSFTAEEQQQLSNYLDLWRESIINLSKHDCTPSNYKDDSLESSTKYISSLFDKYKSDNEKRKCLTDFYQIAYVDAKYQLEYLKSSSIIGGESSFVYDEVYDRYVYDIAQAYNIVGETYYPDDF